jgi:hypothetical protein
MFFFFLIFFFFFTGDIEIDFFIQAYGIACINNYFVHFLLVVRYGNTYRLQTKPTLLLFHVHRQYHFICFLASSFLLLLRQQPSFDRNIE